jgi:hypothetical protein
MLILPDYPLQSHKSIGTGSVTVTDVRTRGFEMVDVIAVILPLLI